MGYMPHNLLQLLNISSEVGLTFRSYHGNPSLAGGHSFSDVDYWYDRFGIY